MTYATILASSADAVLATDLNGRVRFMNPAAERLTGWPIRDAQGQRSCVVAYLQSFADEAYDDPVGRVLASREALVLVDDEHLISRHGLRIPVDGGISAVIDNLGRIVGATITLRDVTNARNATEDLKEAAQQLRAVVDTAADAVMALVPRADRSRYERALAHLAVSGVLDAA